MRLRMIRLPNISSVADWITLCNYSSGPVRDFHPASLIMRNAHLYFSYVVKQTLS